MSQAGLLGLVARIAAILDELGIDYALGGSVAGSLYGEPRATTDVDLALDLAGDAGDALLERVAAEFYVPMATAKAAIRDHDAFNLLATDTGLKVDLFVLGDGLLDRRQIERRRRLALPGSGRDVWVTAPDDLLLRKLDWFRRGGEASDQQWRDVLGIVRVSRSALDLDDLRDAAQQVGLTDLLERALTAGGAYS